jgi:hypothetical protein
MWVCVVRIGASTESVPKDFAEDTPAASRRNLLIALLLTKIASYI